MSRIEVAIAVIIDDKQRVLITQRPFHVSQGGCWEFPGGKLEKHEVAEQALIREIKEELGLDIQGYEFLGQIHYQYPDTVVELSVFQVTHFFGEPKCLAGQIEMKWMNKGDLNPEHFPKANRAIFDLIL